MIEIEPGPELDEAVAEAIDYHRYIATGYEEGPGGDDPQSPMDLLCYRESVIERLRFDDSRFPPGCIPSFSIDLNAAFMAAAAAGLFSKTFWRTLGMDEFGETWGIYDQDGNMKKTVAGEDYATPALAICAAILELRKESHEFQS